MTDYQKAPIPPALRWEVWERDDFTCHYCGARRFLTLDHLVAESRGGATVSSNLVTACQGCNARKGCKEYQDFRWEMFSEFWRSRLLWRPEDYMNHLSRTYRMGEVLEPERAAIWAEYHQRFPSAESRTT